MPEPQAPSDDQLADAKAAADKAIAEWEDDFPDEQLEVKYKPEDKEETKDDVDTETDEPSEEKDTADEAKPEDEVVETLPEVEPVVTVEDPGEYVPADHSFEVTLADGKTHKVSTPEEAEKLADDPENFETPKQLMEFINKQNKMNAALDKDFEKWEAKHKTFTEQLETETQRRETVDRLGKEMQYLTDKGLLPAIAKEYESADWTDPEIAKQPGVKEQIELINFMVKENATREKAGVSPLSSMMDAYNAMQLEKKPEEPAKEVKDDDEEERQTAGQARKAAGAKVAGVSPSQQASNVPKGIAVGNPNALNNNAAIWDD